MKHTSVYLDIVRGLAAIGVLLHHWKGVFGLRGIAIPGHQCVVVFFVMSGYLVGGSVLRSVQKGVWSWKAYMTARGTRLYVVLLPALLFGGAMDVVGTHLTSPVAVSVYTGVGSSSSTVVYYAVAHRLNITTAATNAFFLNSIRPLPLKRSAPPFGSNGSLWSLAYEFWFYVAFPLLVFTVHPRSRVATRLMAVAGLILWGVLVGYVVMAMLMIWLFGVALNFLPPLKNINAKRLSAIAFTMLAAGFIQHLGQHGQGEAAETIYLGDFVLGMFVALFLWAAISAEQKFSLRTGKVANHMASTSYTLYLVHLPALVLLRALQINVFVSLALIVLYVEVMWFCFERNTDSIRSWIGGMKRSGRLRESAMSYQRLS